MCNSDEIGASVPFTFDCAGRGNALCRARFLLFMLLLVSLYLLCAPFVLSGWLKRMSRRCPRREVRHDD